MSKVINSHGIPFFCNRFEDRIFECCYPTLSVSPLLYGLMGGVLRFIFFICRHEKFTAFVCSLGLLLPDSTIVLAAKLSVCQNSELLLRHSGAEHKVKYLLPALPMWNSYIFLC